MPGQPQTNLPRPEKSKSSTRSRAKPTLWFMTKEESLKTLTHYPMVIICKVCFLSFVFYLLYNMCVQIKLYCIILFVSLLLL